MKSKKTQIIILFLVVMSGCSPLLKVLYGIKKPKSLDEKQILEYAEKLNIPETGIYEPDTSYISFILSLDTVKYKSEIKNHYQPLQALYYDNKGNLISFHVNCYAGGFPNLKWNREGSFDIFPPKTQAPVDSILPLKKLMGFLEPLTSSQKINAEQYDYIVIIFWNRFMKRQSKRLIRTVQENCRMEKNKTIRTIYVNDDNLFAE